MTRLEQLERYLAERPGDRFALYGVALERKKAGDVAGAAAAFAELLRLHPTSGAGHLQHGMLWADEGDDEAAIRAWRAGLDALAGLDDPDARRSRGEIEAALASLE